MEDNFSRSNVIEREGGKSSIFELKNKWDRINTRLDIVIKYKGTRRHSNENFKIKHRRKERQKNMNSFSDLNDHINQSNLYVI